jgi:histidyl-tRNA synthetase
VRESLQLLGLNETAVEKIVAFIKIQGDKTEIFSRLLQLGVANSVFNIGVGELKEVVEKMEQLGVPAECYKIDLSIARGLDYYTGTVYETILNGHAEIGSICSGGRYDNLAAYYTDRQLPGVGVSIGLTRLFYKLQEAGLIKSDVATLSRVLIVPLVAELSPVLGLANFLRQNQIPAEVYFEDAQLKKKLDYADKLKIPYVIFVGEDEIKEGKWTVKNMKTGEQNKVDNEELLKKISIQD